MTTDPPDLSISRVFDAPRALVYRAFTDPEQLAAWWGPTGSVRPLDEMDFDVRPGARDRSDRGGLAPKLRPARRPPRDDSGGVSIGVGSHPPGIR